MQLFQGIAMTHDQKCHQFIVFKWLVNIFWMAILVTICQRRLFNYNQVIIRLQNEQICMYVFTIDYFTTKLILGSKLLETYL